jgi:hypothetical protein
MAKSKQRQQPIPSRQGTTPLPPAAGGSPPIQLGYDPNGPKESVDILSTKEGWSEFELSDGTVLRAKAVVLDARRMVDQYNQDGDPIYEMQLTMMSQARVPPELKKKR